jgi:hypothetical protein
VPNAVWGQVPFHKRPQVLTPPGPEAAVGDPELRMGLAFRETQGEGRAGL